MADESIGSQVKKVIAEICKSHQDLDTYSPFSVIIYDPLQKREQGISGTRTSLESAVHMLVTQLKGQSKHIGEIATYRSSRRIMVYKEETE